MAKTIKLKCYVCKQPDKASNLESGGLGIYVHPECGATVEKLKPIIKNKLKNTNEK